MEKYLQQIEHVLRFQSHQLTKNDVYSIGRMMHTIGKNLQYGGELTQNQQNGLRTIQERVGRIIGQLNEYLEERTSLKENQVSTSQRKQLLLFTTSLNTFPTIQTTIPFIWYSVNPQKNYMPINIFQQNNETTSSQTFQINQQRPTIKISGINETICFSVYQKYLVSNIDLDIYSQYAIQYQYDYNQKILSSIPQELKNTFEEQNKKLNMNLQFNNIRQKIQELLNNQSITFNESTGSKQKPIFVSENNQLKFIVKKGDYFKEDPRNDSLIMAMAELLNRQKQNNQTIFNIPTYGVYPLYIQDNDSYVLVEALPNPVSLNQLQTKERQSGGSSVRTTISKLFPTLQIEGLWNYLNQGTNNNKQQKFKNFKNSLVDSIVLQWLFGILDRHNDNILILNDGRIANIDFEMIFNQFRTVAFDGKSKDVLVEAPFVLSPDMAYALWKINNTTGEITSNQNNKPLGYAYDKIPSFFTNKENFNTDFGDFADLVLHKIQKVVQLKDEILTRLQVLFITNNHRLNVQKDGEDTVVNQNMSANENIQKVRDIGYEYVVNVLKEWGKYTNNNNSKNKILYKLYISMTQTPYQYLFAGHSFIHPVSSKKSYPIQTDPETLPIQTNNQLYNKLVEVLTEQGQTVSGNQDVDGRGVDNAVLKYAYMLSTLYNQLNNNNELKEHLNTIHNLQSNNINMYKKFFEKLGPMMMSHGNQIERIQSSSPPRPRK